MQQFRQKMAATDVMSPESLTNSYLFHLTRTEYVESIIHEGLIPVRKRGITTPQVFKGARKRKPFVFLTDNPYLPIKQLYCEYSFKEWVFLVVNVSDIKVEHYRKKSPYVIGPEFIVIPNELIVRQAIPPKNIVKATKYPCELLSFASFTLEL